MGQNPIHHSLKLVSSHCLCHFFLLTGRTSKILPPAPSWVPCTKSQSCVSKPGLARGQLQCGLPKQLQPLLGIYLLHLPGLQGDSLPCHGLHLGLQGNLCSRAQSTSCPSFCNDLGVCRVVHLTSLHVLLHLQVSRYFFPLLIRLSQRHCHHCSQLWAQPWTVCLCAGWNWLNKGGFQHLLTEAALIGLLLPKFCHAYTIQSFNYTSDLLPDPGCNYTTKEILVLQTQSLQLWKNASKEHSCENVCIEAHVYVMLLSVWSFVQKSSFV